MSAKGLVQLIATTLAHEPDAVEILEGEGPKQLRLRLAPDDVGRVIGRRGRTAKAIRTLLRAAGSYDLQIGGDEDEQDRPAETGSEAETDSESEAESRPE